MLKVIKFVLFTAAMLTATVSMIQQRTKPSMEQLPINETIVYLKKWAK